MNLYKLYWSRNKDVYVAVSHTNMKQKVEPIYILQNISSLDVNSQYFSVYTEITNVLR